MRKATPKKDLVKVTEKQMEFITTLMERKGVKELKRKITYAAEASLLIGQLTALPDVVQVRLATEKQVTELNRLFTELTILNPVEKLDYNKMTTKEASEKIKEYRELISIADIAFF